ncbi:hypothetical protein SAMN04487950_1331 [Halogranum rubrum]|uniref:Uncharacterized protein n=1 Tax=Halogranum rubrum TaxID=553466 RepID=A0A1I4CTA6_9EURY|nr:hypothetical protein [Halogranum rubrum]SFK83256.1 hypothetical protein SAMN04487950_1331 [Halogranum rubrum]
MRTSTTVSIFLAVVLLATGSAFLLLDFHAGQSDTTLSSTVAANAIDNATTRSEAGLYLYSGDDELDRRLVVALAEQGIEATPVSTLEAQYDRPVLYVATNSVNYTYTPVAPRGGVSWEYGYAADGNATIARSLVESDSFVVVVRDTPPADADYRYYLHGELTNTDESSGVYSLPAYRNHLTIGAAESTATSLAEQFRLRA